MCVGKRKGKGFFSPLGFGAARGSDDQGPISAKGDGQEGVRPTARLLSPWHKNKRSYCEHGQAPHIRSLVRGKETKSAEFGAKAHKFQIDGISFLEHLGFDAFHEGNRFQDTVFKAQRLTRTRTRFVCADVIYPTNKNRRVATKYDIGTDFKRKGRAGKHEKQRSKLAGAITKERASRLEGSFGKDKEHYHLKRIRARTKETEVLWIFFGIHTGNALEIGRRMAAMALEKAA